MRVNSNFSELRQQQQAAAAASRQAAPAEPKKSSGSKAGDSAEIRAAIANENKAAGRNEPLDAATAASTAQLLRAMIQADPNAALGAHDISADRARELLQ